MTYKPGVWEGFVIGSMFMLGASVVTTTMVNKEKADDFKKDSTVAEQNVTKQDLFNLLDNVQSKDEMYKVMSKLLYNEVKKTDDVLKNVSSPDLEQMSHLQKTALRDIQALIKARSANNENTNAVKEAEVKFRESLINLNVFIKDQAARSLGLSPEKTNQSQTQTGNSSMMFAQMNNSR